MKKLAFLSVSFLALNFLLISTISASGMQVQVGISQSAKDKVLSGKLYLNLAGTVNAMGVPVKKSLDNRVSVIIYSLNYPTAEQKQKLDKIKAVCYRQTWTPPAENHPFGFFIASIPVENLPELLDFEFVKMLDSAERGSTALNNLSVKSVRAPMLWDKGYTGNGIKIGILDSGIDISYAGSDLPTSFEYKDYAYFPVLDDNVANTVTGHGTHVAATALGRGTLSAGQNDINNGKGPFKGSAPGAGLVFLKIGQDDDAWATDESLIAAIDAAVNIYHVDIISLSYGGWDVYHDGSSAVDQKVDWAYSQGVPFFCSAGNDAEAGKHYSGTLSPMSTSDFIKVDVTSAGTNDTKLQFNLIWSDGSQRNDLTLQYFNSSKNPLSEVTIMPATESPRGTESRYSFTNNYLPSGNGTYYLKITNNSPNTQAFHIYEDWSQIKEGTNHVVFTNSDPNFTIGSPASGDHAFAVGAYVSRTTFTNNTPGPWWWGVKYVYNQIAPFSSIGPRVDGLTKPDICAPGHVVLSLRDKDAYPAQNSYWVDNDGIAGGPANYYAMRGTSMACPAVSGAAALFLEKHPDATPGQIYSAFREFSNKSGLTGLPNNTWGAGKLDVFSAAMAKTDPVIVDGNMTDEKYQTLAQFTSGRNGFGNDNSLGALKFHSDGKNLYIGITGEVKGNDNILLFFDFSGVSGRGTATLGGGNSGDFVFSAFSYMGNVRMDLDADFALAFNKGNSTMHEFFTDGIRYGTSNVCANIGKTNQYGARSFYDIGPVFGGTGDITVSFDSTYRLNANKGVEVSIPISAFTGVDVSQTVRLFAVITSIYGNVSNECMPGDPGPSNLGDGADLAVIPSQNFFTGPVKISGPDVLQVTAFLEGAFNSGTGMMNATLNTSPQTIPLSQPFNVPPWNYSGTENVISIPAGVVDWVLVELRDAATAAAAIPATKLTGWPKAFFLKTDGSIVSTDGTSLPEIGGSAVTNSLFVVIRHRNHLAVMSATGAVLAGNTYSFDFTTGTSQCYGGATGCKLLGTKAVMVAGDIDHDGNIFVSDFNGWASGFGMANGYYTADLDMDRNVYVSDFNKWASNFGSAAGINIKSGGIKPKYFSSVPR